MTNHSRLYEEIRVFEGVAEPTGNTVDRQTVRGSAAVCRSINELTRKVRRLGDGYFYVPSLVWPEGVEKIQLFAEWVPIS